MSRPKLPPGSAKNKLIQIRVTPYQKRLLHDVATQKGKTMSEYVLAIAIRSAERVAVMEGSRAPHEAQ